MYVSYLKIHLSTGFAEVAALEVERRNTSAVEVYGCQRSVYYRSSFPLIGQIIHQDDAIASNVKPILLHGDIAQLTNLSCHHIADIMLR